MSSKQGGSRASDEDAKTAVKVGMWALCKYTQTECRTLWFLPPGGRQALTMSYSISLIV